jgi:hypothetical protein
MVITAIAATPTTTPIPAFTPVLPTDEGFAAADADDCVGKGEEDEAFEIVLHPSMLYWLMEELAKQWSIYMAQLSLTSQYGASTP